VERGKRLVLTAADGIVSLSSLDDAERDELYDAAGEAGTLHDLGRR
jgi:hypothetical protein